MEARFSHPQRENVLGMVFCVLSCAFFCVLLYVPYEGDESAARAFMAVLAVLFLTGAAVFAVYACLMRGMHLCVADGRIEGQTNLHRRFSLPAEQVAYVNEFGDTVILYDRDGRSYVFVKMENAILMWEEILAMLARDEPTEQTASELRERIQRLRRSYLHKILSVMAAALCMFGSIAVGAIGTGGRDFPQMTAKDWRITGYSAAGFVLSLVVMLYFAQRGGRENLQIQITAWRLRGVMAALAPVSVENVISVYLNQSHRERITFYRAEDGIHVHFEQMLDNGKVKDEGEYPEARASKQELLEAIDWGDMASFEKRLIRIR